MRSFTLLSLLACPLTSLAEFQLDPTLHLTAVTGLSSADNPGDLAAHGHDPNDDIALQGLDVGLNLGYDEWLAGFINANTFTTPDGELDAELEEAFLKFQNLPGGFEIRGGRYLNRFGLQNNVHLHGWDFVNANLSTSRFLGDEALISEGLELTWLKESDYLTFAVSGSFGKAVEHDGHGHDEEDEHHDDDHDDDDHDDDDHDEHGHSGEEALFTDDLATLRALLIISPSDFHQHRIGFNGAWGDNGYGRDTALYSTDYVYQWRENGLESGGREFSAGAEYFFRDVEWANDEGDRGQTSQNGFMVFAQYRFAGNWTTDIRYEEIQGREPGPEVSLGEERERLSLALTRDFEIRDWDSYARLQYSHDNLEDGSEDTVWLQFGFNFGDGEVR